MFAGFHLAAQQKFTHTTSSVLASTVNQIAVQFTHSPAGTAGAADYYEITGVQLEVGSTATDFEHRSYGEELALCQRYYQQTTGIYHPILRAYAPSATALGISVDFPVTMRVIPTLTKTGTWVVSNSGQPSVVNASVEGYEMLVTANGAGLVTTYPDGNGGNLVKADAEL